jgi:transcriptional regulator with XRE-family HTH domain
MRYNMGMDKKTLGGRIRRLREEKALTQAELAEAAGITAVQVGRIERGLSYPHPRTRRRIAEALGVGPKELIKEDG